MLVLGRRAGEAVRVIVAGPSGPAVLRVTLLKIQNGKIRLGFEGPEAFTIEREELTTRKSKGGAA